MEMLLFFFFLKKSYKLMFKLDNYIFEILKLSFSSDQKKSISCVASFDIIHVTA